MKLYLLTLVFAIAQAKKFNVTDQSSPCLLLELDGFVSLTAADETVTVKFNDAEMINDSSCTAIKLKLNNVTVWFQFNDVSGEWEVTPIATFVPRNIFGDKVKGKVLVTYTSKPLENKFMKNESYQCLSATPLTFEAPAGADDNINVTAETFNFSIQSYTGSKFLPGVSCSADKRPTAAPVTTTTTQETTTTTQATTTTTQATTTTTQATTTTTQPTNTTTQPTNTTTQPTNTTTHVTSQAPTTASPTTTPKPQPGKLQDFTCMNDNITRLHVQGSFALTITYNKTGNKPTTVIIDVPEAQVDNKSTECSSNSSETLTFKFFNGWSIEYVFQKETADSKKYYISNVTVTYVHDDHLQNSTLAHNTSHAHYSKVGYLEASTSGYYYCKAKINLAVDEHVTLTTHDFKYKAFNEKGDIKFDSGDVMECTEDEETSSVVPIAVGAALAGLVVIVLIAYLIGRRRSRKAGYESV